MLPHALSRAGEGEVEASDVVIAWPTGEALDRAWLVALHDRGAARTPEEETRYRELAATYGNPALHTIEWYGRYLQLDDLEDARTDEEEEEYLELGRDSGFDGADIMPEMTSPLERTVIGVMSSRAMNGDQNVASRTPLAITTRMIAAAMSRYQTKMSYVFRRT